MIPNEVLKVGKNYSKKDLSLILNEPNLAKVREGVASCKNSESYFIFVDLEKNDKEEKFHFDDYFEESFFHWDSQTTQHINTPKIQDLIHSRLVPHLFVRIKQKHKSKTLPFIYCGRLRYYTHDDNTSKPVHIVFENIDFDGFTENKELLEIYMWDPSKIGKGSKSEIFRKGTITEKRKISYNKPNRTERRGLVKLRVGQIWWRQQIIKKWGGKCAATGVDILSILTASHIVAWRDSSDEEKLDANNGILLSPIYDALFDKNLISFDNNGNLLMSSELKIGTIKKLGISSAVKISVTEGMIKYLTRHRQKMK